MRRLPLLILAAVFLLAPGCGEDDKDTYANDVREVGEKLNDSDIASQLRNVESADELATALGEAAGLLDDAAADLDELEPPDDVADAHTKLTEGARETADSFQKVAEQAKSGNSQDLVASLQELTTTGGAAKLDEGLKELERKGYDVRNEGK